MTLADAVPDVASPLGALGRRRTYPRGSVLFFQGDPSRDVLFIVSGDVRLDCLVATDSQMLELLGAGDWLGEMGAIAGEVRSATAVAVTSVEVDVLDREAFAALLHDPAVASQLLLNATRRLARASRRQAELGATDALGRVCARLTELAERFGEPSPDGVTIRSPLSQHDIASWAGISRETVVKSLSTLRTLGWVRTHSRQITLLRPDAVASRSGAV
jgi:CRP/FNR family transcriptional regulator, cyclic AMP receptor protein